MRAMVLRASRCSAADGRAAASGSAAAEGPPPVRPPPGLPSDARLRLTVAVFLGLTAVVYAGGELAALMR